MKMSKFTDIGQYRTVVKNIKKAATYVGQDSNNQPIYNNLAEMPTIRFYGTVKLHGTNSGVCQNANGEIWAQSRESIITINEDNAGFAFFVHSKIALFTEWFKQIRKRDASYADKIISIFGEWCGAGIQKGVAINGLPKMFVIFAIKITSDIDDEKNIYLDDSVFMPFKSEADNIYNVRMFKQFYIDIDFNRPDIAQNELVNYTISVENECPVGKYFGRDASKGDCVVGEGIVWSANYKGCRYIFKTKGKKHSASKVKTVASVDVEKLNTIHEFIEYAVTENRMYQAIEQVFTTKASVACVEKTGDFIKWIISDIIKEEIDTLTKNGIEPKTVYSHISTKARKWYMNFLNKEAGI